MKRSGALGLADQVDFLYGQTPVSLAGNLLTLVVVLALVWGPAPLPALAGFAGVFALLWLLRLLLYRRYLRSPDPNKVPALSRRWLAWWNVGTVAAGMFWGAASWVFYPLTGSEGSLVFVLSIHGFCLASIPVLATQPFVFRAFAICSLGPLTLAVGVHPSGNGSGRAVVLVLLFLVAAAIGRKFRQRFDETLRLKARAEQLAEQSAASEAQARLSLAQARRALRLAGSQSGQAGSAMGVDAGAEPVVIGSIWENLGLDVEARAFEKGIGLGFHGHRHAVHADPLLVERVLRLALECALRNTSYGGVIVTARPLGGIVRLQVWDTSEGADRFVVLGRAEGEVDVSPDRFGDFDPATREALSDMARCAGQLGADLRVKAVAGRGALYELRVPRLGERLLEPGENALDLPGRLHGANITVIDPNPASRSQLCAVLEAWHAEVQALAPPCAEAIDPRTELAVLNLAADSLDRLPALLATVRQAVGERLPVLAVVPGITAGLRRQALAARFHLIAKPIRLKDLRAMVHFKLGVPLADRDPSLGRRLAEDGRYWSRALGLPELTPRRIARIDSRGFLFQPASRLALRCARGEQTGHAHVVMLHGGVSSVRGAMGDLLSPQAGAMPWRSMPLLEELCVWRFEHDSFIPVMHNVGHLVAQVERHICVAGKGEAAMRCVALVAHSRGGVVARLAAAVLQQRWPGARFHAYTFGSPHGGTWVFRRVSERWASQSPLLGAIRNAIDGVAPKETTTQLDMLKRALSYDLPVGYRDIEPDRVENLLAAARDFRSYTTWSSHWIPQAVLGARSAVLGRLLLRLSGLVTEGDGLVTEASACGQGSAHHDLSPVFHTAYFADPRALAQLRSYLHGFFAVEGLGS